MPRTKQKSRSRIIAELIVPKAVQNKDITIEVLTLSYLSLCVSPPPLSRIDENKFHGRTDQPLE